MARTTLLPYEDVCLSCGSVLLPDGSGRPACSAVLAHVEAGTGAPRPYGHEERPSACGAWP